MTYQHLSDLYKRKYDSVNVNLCRDTMESFADSLMRFTFPALCGNSPKTLEGLEKNFKGLQEQLNTILHCLTDELHREIDFESCSDNFFNTLPELEAAMNQDAQFILDGDPAAKSLNEVVICYPGFYAIGIYRIAHHFHKIGLSLFARILTEFAHRKTGIDIHPGASIGVPFFIDHGTGVVIGETTQIGQKVKIYQGVTLGASSVSKNMAQKKRHPTVEDNCIIYSNATILGGDTIIGKDSIIGGNVWLTESVPQKSKIFYQQ